MSPVRWLLLFFGLLLAGGMIYFMLDYVLNNRVVVLGFDPTPSPQPRPVPLGSVFLYAGVMVVGIFCGSVHDRIRRLDDRHRSSVKKILTDSLKSKQLLASLLAAPIVFTFVYSSTKSEPDSVIAVLFSFQNGFVCNKMLEVFYRQEGAAAGATPPIASGEHAK